MTHLWVPRGDLLPSQQIEHRLFRGVEENPLQVRWPDPITFAEKVFCIEPNEVQKEMGLTWYTPQQADAWLTIMTNKHTMLLSGNGIGKTMLLAVLAYYLWCDGWTVVTTAMRGEQVDQLWAKIRALKIRAERIHGRALPGRWMPSEHLVFDPDDPEHKMRGFTTREQASEDVSTAFQGLHYKKVAVLADEAIGIRKSVLEAMDRVAINDHPNGKIVLCGNPTDEAAPARELEKMTHHDTGKPIWAVRHYSSEDHPNVIHNRVIIPGCATRSFCDLQLSKGGSRESAYYRTAIRGLWAGQKQDALIQLDWIERAVLRSEVRNELEARLREGGDIIDIDPRGVALGVDVADVGGDLTVMTAVEGSKFFWPKIYDKNGTLIPCWHRGKDTTHCEDMIIAAIKSIPRVLCVCIDDTGLGATVASHLWKRRGEFPEIPIYITKGPTASPDSFIGKVNISRVNFGGAPLNNFDKTALKRMKDVLWWKFREGLRENRWLLPTDAEFRAVGFPSDMSYRAQLLAPKLWKDDGGKLWVLDRRKGSWRKELTKELPEGSPDVAHSMILAAHAYDMLPERQAAPKTTQQHFETRLRAEMEHAKQLARNPNVGERIGSLDRVTM